MALCAQGSHNLVMDLPTVVNPVNDPARGVVYHVRAYRSLSRSEMLAAVAQYLRSKKNKHPKKGTVVTIISLIGFDE